jgi:hypothetical protein
MVSRASELPLDSRFYLLILAWLLILAEQEN